MQTCFECGREYYPKQAWIHVPACRYYYNVTPNHVPPEKRRYAKLTVTEIVQSVTQTVTKDVESVTAAANSNAERQRRWRERQKLKNA